MQESMRRTAGPLVKAHSKGIEVHVEEHVKDKMQGWCNAANSEVSGLFMVHLVGGIFTVYDVFLPEQMGSSGFTKIDGHATGRLYSYLRRRYGLSGMADLKGWWHTHYTFGVFWSGTDDDTAQSNATLAEDWSLSIVINQKGDWLARVDVVSPIPVMVDNLPIRFVSNAKAHRLRDYARDIRRWVKPMETQQRSFKRQIDNWVSDKPLNKPSYVNYAGMLISQESFKQIMECPCADMTCIDCSSLIKEAANA